jgi:hypothetical protein
VRKRRPWSECRRWFAPHPRVGARQVTCGAAACQRHRHRRADRHWHRRHPDYDRGRRLQATAARAVARGGAQGLRSPPPLAAVPWGTSCKTRWGSKPRKSWRESCDCSCSTRTTRCGGNPVERQGNPADFPGGDRQEEIGRARRRWHPEGVDLELELHQLALPHADLRIDDPVRRQRLTASLATVGQQVPVGGRRRRGGRAVWLIDGSQRVGVLRRLGSETVVATAWPVDEAEALIQRHHFAGVSRSVLEEAWLWARRHGERGLALDALAQRFCRSKSRVSRRRALLGALPVALRARARSRRSTRCSGGCAIGVTPCAHRRPVAARPAGMTPVHRPRRRGRLPTPEDLVRAPALWPFSAPSRPPSTSRSLRSSRHTPRSGAPPTATTRT